MVYNANCKLKGGQMNDSRFSQDFEMAKKLVEESEGEVVYASMLQRKMSIGYVYARSILDEMARKKLVNFDGEKYTKNKSAVFHTGIKQVDEVKNFKGGLHLIIDKKLMIPISFTMKMINHLCLEKKEVVVIKTDFVLTYKMLVSQNARIPSTFRTESEKNKYLNDLQKESAKLKDYNLTEICVYNNDFVKIKDIIIKSIESGSKYIFLNYLLAKDKDGIEKIQEDMSFFLEIDKIAKAYDAMVVISFICPLSKTLKESINIFFRIFNVIPTDQMIFVEDNQEDFNLIFLEKNGEVLKTDAMAIDSRRFKILEDWSL